MRFWGNASSLFDVDDADAEDTTRVLQTSSKSLDVKKNAPLFLAAALSQRGENKKGDPPEDVVVPFRRKRKSLARDEMRDMMMMMMMMTIQMTR